MEKNKQTQTINVLTSPADFTEQLSLSELSTQMVVLNFLQTNLLDYQRNFVKSFIMTIPAILDILPDDEYSTYLKGYQESFWIKDRPEFDIDLASKFYSNNCEYWIIDYKNKKLIPFGNKDIKKYKFTTNKQATELTMFYHVDYQSYHRGFASTGKLSIDTQTISFKFDIIKNQFIGFVNDFKSSGSTDVGFWSEDTQSSYDHKCGNLLWSEYSRMKK